jgi:tetratricopeptide (TPR) repeat protein
MRRLSLVRSRAWGIGPALYDHIIRFAAIVFLLLNAGIGRSQTPLGAIEAALRTHDYENALRLAQSELSASPKDPRLLTMEGLAFSGLGKKHEALEACEQALKVSPGFRPALETAAQIEYQANSDHAIELLNQLIEQRPSDKTSHAMLAVLFYRRHDCGAAVKNFAASLPLLSEQPIALGQYGGCLLQLHRPAEAVPIFQQRLDIAPEDHRARADLALAYFLDHKFAQAIEILQPILTNAQAGDARALAIASQAYEASGDTPHAVDLARRAIVLDPQNPEYFLAFATLSFDHDSFQVGIDVLSSGIARLPKSAPLYLARGILHIRLAQFDQGEADFEKADQLEPGDVLSSEALGLTKVPQNEPGQALGTLRAQMRAHPDDSFLPLLFAESVVQNGAQPDSPEFKEAIVAASRAVRIKPDFAPAHAILGGLYLKTGDLPATVKECRLALRDDPSNQVAMYHLIQALRREGQTAEIPELLKRLALEREAAQKKEENQGNYKLVEGSPASGAPAEPQR